MTIFDWSNRILIDSTTILPKCSYCKQDADYDKNNECKNCGAHKDNTSANLAREFLEKYKENA